MGMALFCLILCSLCFGLQAIAHKNRTATKTTPTPARTPTTGILRPATDKDEDSLFRDLFQGYNQDLRPAVNKEDNVTVQLGLTLQQIIDMDEKNQVIKISVWIRQIWYNPLLRWNKTHYGGIKTINVSPKKVWKPDLYLYNNADDSTDGSLERAQTRVKVDHDGRNLWLLPTIITNSCPIKVKHFPFDEQRCRLKFGSWTYDGFQLDLVPEGPEGSKKKFVPNGEWDLVDIPAERNELKYDCCPEPYPDVTFIIILQRKYLFYLFNLVIPCFVIVLLTLLSFYLPPESGERISLVITNLLAIAVFMLIVAEILPPTSNEVSIISIFYTCSIVEVGIALIGTCVVLKYHCCDHSVRKMPSWVRHIVLQVFGRLFNVTKGSSQNQLETVVTPTGRKVSIVRDEKGFLETLIPKSDSRDQKLVAELRKRQNGSCLRGRSQSGNGIDEKTKQPDSTSNLEVFPKGSSLSIAESQAVNAILSKQDEMIEHMGVLAEAQASQDEDDSKKKEWIIAAVIFDKLFFCIFIFCILMSTLIILCSIPQQ